VHFACAVAGASLGSGHFSEAFGRSVGMSPHQYILRRRVDAAKQLLADGDLPVAEVASALGFSTQSHFGRIFRQITGMTPKRYRASR
jgi:AraC family transcriptional regulator